MDDVKKTLTEKYIFAGLVVVFVLTFVKGPLKSLGLFGRQPPPVSVVTSPRDGGVSSPAAPEGMVQDEGRSASQQPASDEEERAPGASMLVAKAYTASHLRDPFKSLLPGPAAPPAVQARTAPAAPAEAASSPDTPPPRLRVQGQLWGGLRPKAIINDGVYAVGDVVEGAKILAINRRGVTIEYDGAPLHYDAP